MESFSNIFENGLQPLSKNDIRAMLQEALPWSIKYKLIGRDIDDITNPEALPDNPYVNELLNMAEGNPLYVHFLVEDLEAEKTTVYNEKQLPQGLTEYYIKLMDSLNATDVGRTLPLIVAILACADEPLDRESLHDLVAEGELETVDEAIRYGNSMLSTQPTNDKKEGFTLYHSSLRDHVLSETSKLKGTVKEARKRILERAKDWDSMPSNSLRNHLFRCANSYAARWGDETMLQEAIGRLTNFEYLHARISTLAGRNLPRFLEEYNLCISKNHDVGLNNTLRSFQSFLRLEWDLIRNTGDDPENLGKGATQLVVAGCLSSSPVLDAAYDFAKKKKIPILLRKIGPYLQPYWRRSFPGNRGDCGAAKFSPDGKIVALAVKSKLWLLNSETGESVAEAKLEGDIQGLLFNTDEQIFACTREGPLNRISLMKAYENGELKECSHWVFECDRLGMSTTETGPMAVAMTFINDSTDIKISIYQLNLEKYSLLHEHKIKGINLKTSHKNNDVRQGLDTELQTNIALSFSGESIFIRLPGECDKNVRGEIRSINVKTGKDQWVVALSTESRSGSGSRMLPLAVSLTGNYVAVEDGKDEILLIESRTGKVIWRAPAHYWGINSLAFSVDGLTLYSGGGDFCIKQWDCATGKVIRSIDQHSDRIACLAAGATGLVSIGMDGQAMRWILKDEEQTQFNRRLLPMGCLSLSISIDGRYVAAGGKGNPYDLNRYPEYGTSCLAIADIENGKVIYPDGVNGAGAVSFFGDTDILCRCWRNPDKCFFDTKNERWLDIRLPEGFNPNLCAVSDDNHFLLLLSDAKPHQFIIFNTELEQIGSSVLGDGNVSYLAPSLGEGVFTIGLRDGENPLAVYLDSDGGLLIKEKASPEEKVAAGFTRTVFDQLSRSDKYAFSKKRDSDRLEVFSMINKNSIIALPIGIKARIIASKGDLVALGDDAGRVLLYQVEQWESEVN
jgi:WD40 repeat protein